MRLNDLIVSLMNQFVGGMHLLFVSLFMAIQVFHGDLHRVIELSLILLIVVYLRAFSLCARLQSCHPQRCRLLSPHYVEPDQWPGRWFHAQLISAQLQMNSKTVRMLGRQTSTGVT
jgi:hypothetical protein